MNQETKQANAPWEIQKEILYMMEQEPSHFRFFLVFLKGLLNKQGQYQPCSCFAVNTYVYYSYLFDVLARTGTSNELDMASLLNNAEILAFQLSKLFDTYEDFFKTKYCLHAATCEMNATPRNSDANLI